VADEYRQAMIRGSELVEKHAEGLSLSRVEELVKIFVHATNVSDIAASVLSIILIGVRWREDFGTWD